MKTLGDLKESGLIKQIEEVAAKLYDGHYSIFAFTGNYKGFFGTPNGDPHTYLPYTTGYKNLSELLHNMIERPEIFNIEEIEKIWQEDLKNAQP